MTGRHGVSGSAAGQPAGPERFHVTMTFRPGGPAVAGTWTDGAIALRKFRSWVGSHGSRGGVVIELSRESGGPGTLLRTWTADRGEEIHHHA